MHTHTHARAHTHTHTHTHKHTRAKEEEKRKSRKECLAAGGVAALYQQTYMSVAILFLFGQFPAVQENLICCKDIAFI